MPGNIRLHGQTESTFRGNYLHSSIKRHSQTSKSHFGTHSETWVGFCGFLDHWNASDLCSLWRGIYLRIARHLFLFLQSNISHNIHNGSWFATASATWNSSLKHVTLLEVQIFWTDVSHMLNMEHLWTRVKHFTPLEMLHKYKLYFLDKSWTCDKQNNYYSVAKDKLDHSSMLVNSAMFNPSSWSNPIVYWWSGLLHKCGRVVRVAQR